MELKQVIESFTDISPTYKPKLLVILVEKRLQQKFYTEEEGKYENPPFGTIIDQEIVSNFFDFYMIA